MLNFLTSGTISAADLIILPSATSGVIGFGKPLSNGAYRHAFAFGTAVPKYTYRVFSTPLSDLQADDNGVITHYRTSLIDPNAACGCRLWLQAIAVVTYGSVLTVCSTYRRRHRRTQQL